MTGGAENKTFQQRLSRCLVTLFIWFLETLIGMIPLLAHTAAAAMASPTSPAKIESSSPEVCVLAVVASALSLLSLLRDWFTAEVVTAGGLTIVLALSNLMACMAGTFFYAYAVNGILIEAFQSFPELALAGALSASFLLAVERGFR